MEAGSGRGLEEPEEPLGVRRGPEGSGGGAAHIKETSGMVRPPEGLRRHPHQHSQQVGPFEASAKPSFGFLSL